MRKIVFSLVVALFSDFVIYSQTQPEFAPIGAHWYHSLYCMQNCLHYYKFTSIDTVTIQGKSFKKISVSTDDPIINFFPFSYVYLYGDSSKMYYALSISDSIHLLADFSLNIGDTLYSDNIEYPSQQSKSIINNKGDTIINGFKLHFLQLISLDCEEIYCGKLIQNIGAESFLFPYYGFVDPPIGGQLRCYHDTIIGNYTNPLYLEPCDYHFDSTSIEIECVKSNEPIDVFPNPASDKLLVTAFGNDKLKEIILYNHLGQIIFFQEFQEEFPTYEIDISQFKPGIYFICSKLDNQMCYKKIIII